MSHLFFIFSSKERLKFFLKILAIAIPVLAIFSYFALRYQSSQDAKGTPNDKGGLAYWYKESSGIDQFPEPVARLIAMYPGSQTTYFNVSTNKEGKLNGELRTFTKDDFSKVIAFYKTSGKITEQTNTRLELDKDGNDIIIEAAKAYDDDPIKGQTKFTIFFAEITNKVPQL